MKPHQIIMLGLGLDIVGAFLVAVEAIKLDNLRTLRDRFLKEAHRYTLAPLIRFADGPNAHTELGELPPSQFYRRAFTGLHYLAGAIVLAVADWALEGHLSRWMASLFLWVEKKPWYVMVGVALAVLLYGIIFGLWMLGELVHVVLARSLRLAVRTLDIIEARTADGAVGISGFLLLLTGFVIQSCGVHLQAKP